MTENRVISLPENEDVKSNNEEVLENRPETLFTYFTIGTAFLLIMVGGSTVVWSSPAVVKMKLDDPNENPLGKPIEAVELSILIGLPTVSGLLGCFIIPKLADIVGRKYTLLAIGSVWLLSLIATSFSRNLIMFTSFICISMALQAASFAAVPIYLTEICQHHSRAKLGCILCVFIPIGELITYLVGSVFSIRDFTLIIASPLVVFLVLFHLAPESPVYSLTKGSVEECRRSLKKLRSNKTEKELNIEYDQIKESLDLQEVKSEFVILTLLKSKEGRFGLLLGTIPIVIQYLTGATLVLQLMGPIFDEANTFAGNTIAIIVGIAKVCCFLLASFLVERTGRKPLLIISCVGTGISTAVLSVYFYLNYINDPVIEDLKLLPLIAVLFFIMSYSMGIGPIPLAVISELFPSHARSVAMSFILMFCGVVLTVYNSSYPILDEYAGTHWCFFMFSFFSLLGAVVIYFVVPETKGKSDAEIQQILADY
uniref:Major facilitator superfamily protein n=1 Tax=Phyllotreta armoraciae TaxID=1553667 RepID=A0A858Z6M2_9CUCU|nr:major facilitator superfamily protein [Phyllotreta armoraciae]